MQLIQINNYECRVARRLLAKLVSCVLAEHAIERPKPLRAVGFFRQSLRPQQIAQLRVCADNAERDVAGGEFIMEIMQHACPGQIDIGRGREIAGY